ncbi:ATP-dependent helicase [Shinella kummerowiae]|uniref:ATP-dependent helicase n=1 Tax=Shinella kummerowiae TaxID=417745 RepID=UPI0021B5F705|nr:ATP-dependent helicase [Shinella kummerowiae]MCT7667405.1 ATP-dependent helicase [Shinella kummerowiae]
MAFRGFEGPAGSGKTYRLMEAVSALLQQNPLQPHQKILSLTFMHGSRRRLDAEFRGNPALRGKAVAMTIDSFAHNVWHRWRSLAATLNAEIGDFNQTCDACGTLLEQEAVARWVARTHPIVIVDEAQELAAPRLRMICALENHCTIFVAADEFQCLEQELDTAPFMAWFATGEITPLNHIHRTNQAGLLTAGAHLRQLIAPAQGSGLQIRYEFPKLMPFKIASAIRQQHGTVAVLYPPGGGTWARSLAGRFAQGLHSKTYNIPPIYLSHEPKAADEVNAVMGALGHLEGAAYDDIVGRLGAIESPPPWIARVQNSLQAGSNRFGKTNWTTAEVRSLMERTSANHRAFSGDRPRGIPLLSIHQAKNRQYDHVIILWPHGVPGDEGLKARLLYNGITRARRSCKVFVRAEELLNSAPFTFAQPLEAVVG